MQNAEESVFCLEKAGDEGRNLCKVERGDSNQIINLCVVIK